MPLLGSRFARFAAAVGATVVALVLYLLLKPLWRDQYPLITYYPAIILSAWLGGFWPGLVATVLTSLAYLWFTVRPDPTVGNAISLVLFVGIGLFISWLVDALQLAETRMRMQARGLQDQSLVRARESEAQARLAAIVTFSEDAIISKTLDGIVTSWNSAATKIFGYLPEEMIGRSITTIIPVDRLNEETTVLSAIRRGDAIEHFETIRRRKDGTLIPVSLTVSPIRGPSGEIVGASKIARDITARVQGDEERALLLSNEHAARRQAELANQAKDEFLAMLGHELRNPLGAISNATLILEHLGSRDDATAAARDVIARQTVNLARLMDDLLDAGRILGGKITLQRQSIDLSQVGGRALATLRSAGQLADHRVDLEAVPAWIDADPTRIEQIITNLVTNSLKYTPAGGSIRINVVPEGPMVVLRVEDSGLGIEPTLMPRIFDPFVQGQVPADRSKGGLGIGLTVVKQLVDLHGGSIEAQSAGRDRGTTFTVRLPSAPAPAFVPARQDDNHRKSRRILIVEDNDDAREMLRSLLELWHHTVRAAADGPSALEMAREFPADVALVDVGLPGLDGYEVARRLRASGANPHLKLIALSGYGSPQDMQRSRAAGFDTHMVKPVDPSRLMELCQ